MDRLYYQNLTIPAGNGVNNFDAVAWPLEDNQLLEITIEVPDGHCGLTGVRIEQAQQQIVPFANNSYLISNNRVFRYPFADQITSTGLVIVGYNGDIYPHTFYCTALVTNLSEPGENPEAEVVAPGSQTSSPDLLSDDLSVSSILDQSDLDNLSTGPSSIPPPSPSAPKPVAPVVKKPAPKKKTPTRKILPKRGK
jgi:hypothetical protein